MATTVPTTINAETAEHAEICLAQCEFSEYCVECRLLIHRPLNGTTVPTTINAEIAEHAEVFFALRVQRLLR